MGIAVLIRPCIRFDVVPPYYRELSKRAALEVNFSEMSEAELSQLYTLDEYESNYYRFEVSGSFSVRVQSVAM